VESTVPRGRAAQFNVKKDERQFSLTDKTTHFVRGEEVNLSLNGWTSELKVWERCDLVSSERVVRSAWYLCHPLLESVGLLSQSSEYTSHFPLPSCLVSWENPRIRREIGWISLPTNAPLRLRRTFSRIRKVRHTL
jgi:hypothetical protein